MGPEEGLEAERITGPEHLEMTKPYFSSRLPSLRKFIHRVLPVHTYAPLRAELRMAWVRCRSQHTRRPWRGRTGLLINLAAGDQARPGWLNVDVALRQGINAVYDCRRALPFDTASAKGIFCEHFLEHLDYVEEAPQFLRECHRVLQPGGVLRVIVPDAQMYIRAYCEPGWESMSRIRPLHSGRVDAYTGVPYGTKMELLNHIFRQGFEHKYAYDFETLASLFRRSGFARVSQSQFGRSVNPEMCLDRETRASESLYVEGIAGVETCES